MRASCLIWHGAKDRSGLPIVTSRNGDVASMNVWPETWTTFRKAMRTDRIHNMCGDTLCVNIEHWERKR